MPKPSRGGMTVGALKVKLANIPDSVPILTPAPDHSYRPADIYIATACFKDGYWSEDCGPECEMYDDIGQPIQALIVG